MTPNSATTEVVNTSSFRDALVHHIRSNGDTYYSLHKAIIQPGERFHAKTILFWTEGSKTPRSATSMIMLGRIEERYGLSTGYLRQRLPYRGRATTGLKLPGIAAAERRRLVWHLPDDFDRRSRQERDHILAWVREKIISGSTEYRRYQGAAVRQRFAMRFPAIASSLVHNDDSSANRADANDAVEPHTGCVDAPAALTAEMAALVRFKTSTLTDIGFERLGIWGDETVAQKLEHLGLMFGALVASPDGSIKGLGIPVSQMCLALLVLPSVWDWYVRWRETRRGFYTIWEVDMLRIALALTRSQTGWIRQNPQLADRLKPFPDIIEPSQIDRVRADWNGACDALHKYAMARSKEIERVARIHRDPFEPILPVLEAESPAAEYRKITEEVVRLMPDDNAYPKAAAEAMRSFLMLRLGMHLGLRQKNLRQLLCCPRDTMPSSERQLEAKKCGELRWSSREGGWEVLVPSVAFKNAHSSFFGNRPFRLLLPDIGGLYEGIAAYMSRHRSILLNGADDPRTFFVKTVKRTSTNAAYDQNTFYEAWRLIIQRYGIYNPYTGRGAIEGLLPHGPHSVRDVLATHILKQTGSYEQASYAIQDTPDMVAKHYGRFLPQDKAALAAKILNRVWEAA